VLQRRHGLHRPEARGRGERDDLADQSPHGSGEAEQVGFAW
jgi:hypothetical protein